MLKKSSNSRTKSTSNSKNFMESSYETNIQQKASEDTLSDTTAWRIKGSHQAAIAIGKAEINMQTMLNARNKAINAYKEILGTKI